MDNRIAYIPIILLVMAAVCVGQESDEVDEELFRLEAELKKLDAELKKRDVSNRIRLMDREQATQDSIISAYRYFGYSYFRQSEGGEQSIFENLPVPRNYIIGPGDEIVITLWGDSKLNSTYTIGRDGRIFVGTIDQWLYLTGRTLDEGKEYIRRQFEKAYATLRGSKPTTFMDVSLGTLKSINVQFVGEVNSPGIHTVHPFSTIGSGLIQAGGISMTGSLRDIQIIRGGNVVNTVDLYELFLEGRPEADFRLQEEDLVFVPIRRSTIEVDGEVYRPGIYEALPGESIEQVLDYAGGLRPAASTSLELGRIQPVDSRQSDDNAYEATYLDLSELDSYMVRDGDIINVRKIMDVTHEVYIYGQVKNPGFYSFQDSMRVLALLTLAGGINDPDYLKSVNAEHIDLVRRDLSSNYSKTKKLDLKAILEEDNSQNILLMNHDQVTVYPNLNYRPSQNVEIRGEVLLPGVYPIKEDFETLESILQESGGFTSRAFPEGIAVMRNGRRLVIESFRNTVAPGDVIVVPTRPDVVEVIGAVYSPGLISYKKGRSMSQYIQLAGGFTPEANSRDIIVVYADGSVKPKGWIFSPPLKEGARIQVNSAPPPPPFRFGQFLGQTTAMLTQLLTLWFVLDRLGNLGG